MRRFTDTIAALATPAGTSALALLRVSGPEVSRIARDLLGAAPPPRLSRYANYRDVAGELVDEILCIFFPAANSYTGEDALEISCHGNPYIAQKILQDLLRRGSRMAEPGEFTQRAFLNGRMDLSQAEAVMDLIHARSDRALAAANQQLRGSLGRRMTALTDRLIGLIAQIEAYIDFPDEDLPPEDRRRFEATLGALLQDTKQLLATNRYGNLLRDGIKTVIVGAPNAGKSSLLNRLVGRDRAIVSPEPGTTRDFIEETVMIGPHCLRLIDTAGLNPTPGVIEKLGIEKTWERITEADLILCVVEAGSPLPAFPQVLTASMSDRNSILVVNKTDLSPTIKPEPPTHQFDAVYVSALTGAGFDDLRASIVSLSDRFIPDAPGELVAINARHADALGRGIECLSSALAKVCQGAPAELTASDLRGTLAAYGEIVGRIDNERILDQLFATFCIGK